MRPSLLLALILLDFGWGATGQKRFVFCIPCYILNLELLGQPRHPIIEDDVVIYSGATILGRVTIGRGATIGGNVWLTRSVPPGGFVSQAQLRQEMFDDGSGI